MKVGETCPHCSEGILELVQECEPFWVDYLICPNCDSTYNLEEE